MRGAGVEAEAGEGLQVGAGVSFPSLPFPSRPFFPVAAPVAGLVSQGLLGVCFVRSLSLFLPSPSLLRYLLLHCRHSGTCREVELLPVSVHSLQTSVESEGAVEAK